MNDSTHSRECFPAGDHQRKASGEPQRRAYEPPALRGHAKLPVITAGSISKEMWRFENGDQDR